MLRTGVSRGLVPFDWGAARSHGDVAPPGVEAPVTFSQKVRYKMAHDRRPILKIYADKLAVRDYVRALAPDLRQPRLAGVFSTASEAAANVPPGPWVMKASHGSGMVLVSTPAAPATRANVRRQAAEWLRTDYALKYWEWQYFRLPKHVMFEEYLGDDRGVPDDYKLYVIHQKVRLIEVDQGRYRHHTRDFFRPDWSRIASRIGPAPTAARPPARPALLESMLRIAASLSVDTDFLRVDLYVVRGEIYFGELTHSPAAGNFCFEDPRLDKELGGYWSLDG